jgi:SAM-dependent methyltransferase
MTPATKTLLDRAHAAIDRDRFAAIAERYGTTPTGIERREKYLGLDYWLEVNVRRAERLGLHIGPPRRVLDLGCGCGYFLLVCRLAGHEVLGVDRAERRSLFTEMRDLLGVPWAPHAITVGEPLPALGRFDVVTAHMVTFNGHRAPNLWGPAEWSWLLGELDAPRVYLELNREPDGTVYPPGLRAYFESLGAVIDEHRVLIDRG